LDPNAGRFTSEDPLEFIDGPNLMIYVMNNPLGSTDGMGLCEPCDGIYGFSSACANIPCPGGGTRQPRYKSFGGVKKCISHYMGSTITGIIGTGTGMTAGGLALGLQFVSKVGIVAGGTSGALGSGLAIAAAIGVYCSQNICP
jgi:hypothetical protein